MKVTDYLYQKINDEMRMIYITSFKPKHKIRLDPLDPEDLNADLEVVCKWSRNNEELYHLLLQNGMAEFICNRQFLNQFYTHLQFIYSGLTHIDSGVGNLSNLKVLNLFHNQIKVLQNIPSSCMELYLDFNLIEKVYLKANKCNVELLSLSHNCIDDQQLGKIVKAIPSLRCLNLVSNRLCDIRAAVSELKSCTKLKMLSLKDNPLSMLAIYWDYITSEISLDFFDNKKYVKPEPVKAAPPPEQKKEEKKEEKKDTKKDAKKGGKVEEKPPEPEPIPYPEVKEEPRVLTEEDFTTARFSLNVSIFQGFGGNVYDSSLFPAEDLDIKNTQACFWAQLSYLNKKYQNYENRIPMQAITTEQQTNRLNFEIELKETMTITVEDQSRFNDGITVMVWKQEPVIETDSESGQQKAILGEDNKIKLKKEIVGGCFIRLDELHPMRVKDLKKNFNLFVEEAVSSPLFRRPYENQDDLIQKNRIEFDAKLAELEEAKRKQMEEEEAAKAQKKGGKDSKKAADKKGAKKDSKEPVSDKKAVVKSDFPLDEKQYRYLGEGKMFKCLKEKLAVSVVIQ